MRNRFFLALIMLFMLMPSNHKTVTLMKDLESKALKTKSYYYERSSLKKGVYARKEQKGIFIEGKGLRGEATLFFADGAKKAKLPCLQRII